MSKNCNNKNNNSSKIKNIKPNKTKHISVLEKYFERGYLDLCESKFSAEDRKRVGEMLFYDYYCGGMYNLKSCRLDGVNIPGTSELGNESKIFCRERYLRAVRSVPSEFWKAVRTVCIEDCELTAEETKNKKSILGKYKIYCQKIMLNLGLNRLIKFYLQKNKKSS
ncbi:MAG: hypothetical protein J6039_02980 [Alphaproteobacteria bacterium]|nr:hypothetical protein [Alphaproteobacteria bacterium]